MYNPHQPFGGISILLIGDFIQLPVTTGCNFWSVLYGNVTGNGYATTSVPTVLCSRVDCQYASCNLCNAYAMSSNFHTLPPEHLSRQKWTAKDNEHYKPITKDIVDGVSCKLMSLEIELSDLDHTVNMHCYQQYQQSHHQCWNSPSIWQT